MKTNAQNVNLNLTDINYKWHLSDIDKIEKNNYKVFSCFSCGGGSSLGYKLAGFDVIGNIEIDHKINNVYIKNNKPKFNYNLDIRDFLKLNEYPEELYNLDILDGSPPCSSFSLAGNREKDWGKEKIFKEGSKLQVLDDLFIDFLNIAYKLKPKIIIAENVKGLIQGNAKGYVNLILKKFNEIGYNVQLYLLNSKFMGVPQARERVFFIAQRKDLKFKKLELKFNEKPIVFSEVKSEIGKPISKDSKTYNLLQFMTKKDSGLDDINKRIYNKKNGFNNRIIKDCEVCPTIPSTSYFIRKNDKTLISNEDIINVSTFPQDYDFMGVNIQHICGMSVPPLMMARIAKEVEKQLLNNL